MVPELQKDANIFIFDSPCIGHYNAGQRGLFSNYNVVYPYEKN